MPEKPAASVRRARLATLSHVVARVMTSNSMVFLAFMFLPSEAGEVSASYADGGVMGDNDSVAHDPSVRCADTSPCYARGGKRKLFPKGNANHDDQHRLLRLHRRRRRLGGRRHRHPPERKRRL